MVRWLVCLLTAGVIFSQDDGLPPNFVYLEPIKDFYSREPIEIDIIVTDRNKVSRVSIFYRFNDEINFIQREMQVGSQPVIFDVIIPLDEVESGFIQYYFWAKDEYGNEATWPSGGEDLPMVLPIYPTKKVKTEVEKAPDLIIPQVAEGFIKPTDLKNNLPYYLEIGMLAPSFEVTFEEGVPIIVLSVYDIEQIVDQQTVIIMIDDQKVISNNSLDMITYIPIEPFKAGYHIVHYEAKDLSGELLVKEFSFFVHEKIMDESEIDKITWKEKIKFKGDVGWNTDYDPFGNVIDVHKVNLSAKFQLGDYKFNLSGLTSTNIFDINAREEAKYRQPSTRIKFKMKSPYLNLNYGDNSPEFSEFSLKGTRVRGLSTKIKLGSWETSFVSGETKHRVNNLINQIDPWESSLQYIEGDQVYSKGLVWKATSINIGIEPDSTTGSNGSEYWSINLDTDYFAISNDECVAVEPAMYGLDPINGGDTLAIWSGAECQQVIVYSKINMLTGENGIEKGYLFYNIEECLQECKTPIVSKKGFPIRQLQGFRTSKDFFEHFKLGISTIRSWDERDKTLIPYQVLDEYTYEGNLTAATDFMFHFNNDKTILSGEYGMSMTIDQSFSDTLLIKTMHNLDVSQSLYSYMNWEGIDYCYQNQCIDINGDGSITSKPEIIDGIINNDSLWTELMDSRKKLNKMSKILGFSINDDINGYAEGRGVSGLTGPEVGRLVDGGLDSVYLLFKKPAFKLAFKTPIPLSFTELNFQTELSQAPLNYLSHGSSSIQTDVRNWKNKVAFKILKNQMNFSFGYDKQIKSPWNPESESDGEIKRAITNTKTGSIGLSLRNYPSINYSVRLQDREDLALNFINGALNDSTTGLKKMSTHTIAPTYKMNLGEVNLNLNGNLSLVNDLDLLTDLPGCYEILNNSSATEWGGVVDTVECGTDSNIFYFNKSNNPLKDSGNLTSTYTVAFSFAFPFPLSLNLGWGISINSPNDLRQSKTVISVYSTKVGYKLFENKLNITLGGNFVVGFKDGNGFWDSGEVLVIDNNSDNNFNQGDTFIDKIELNNNKLTLKSGLQYKIPEQNITIGLNLDYSQSHDNLSSEQDDPSYKAKFSIKYGF